MVRKNEKCDGICRIFIFFININRKNIKKGKNNKNKGKNGRRKSQKTVERA